MTTQDPDAAFRAALLARLSAIADALGGAGAATPQVPAAEVMVWDAERAVLDPVATVSRVELSLLKGIAHQCEILAQNTTQFASGLPANNALLWGARGMGKSSLVKAVHADVLAAQPESGLTLVEIHREDIETLPRLMRALREAPGRFILFCDDLSFDHDDASYKSLKAVLEGGVEGRPANVILYATSNRRHLMPRDMMDNERATAINPGEAVEEKVSLSDRFGLWLGFHNCDQDAFLDMVRGYVSHYGIPMSEEDWRPKALEWSITRGSRSGRVAYQFVQDLAGQTGTATTT